MAPFGALILLASLNAVQGQEHLGGSEEALQNGNADSLTDKLAMSEKLQSQHTSPSSAEVQKSSSTPGGLSSKHKQRTQRTGKAHAQDAKPEGESQSMRATLRTFVCGLMMIGLVALIVQHLSLIAGQEGEEKKATSVMNRISQKWDIAIRKGHCFVAYAGYLFLLSIVYWFMSRNFHPNSDISLFERIGDVVFDYVGSVLEAIGLMILRHKMAKRMSAEGISKTCIQMYAITYASRVVLDWPNLSFPVAGVHSLQAMALLQWWISVSLQIFSLLLVLDCLWAVSVLYKGTHDEEIDVIPFAYLFGGCAVLSVVLHPFMRSGFVHSVLWTCSLYTDSSALLPQVVMMARSSGKIATPIAHFVAANAVSRVADLGAWFHDNDVGPQGYVYGFNFSGWLIIGVQLLNLVVVADFMWYYAKAWVSGSALSAELSIPVVDDV